MLNHQNYSFADQPMMDKVMVIELMMPDCTNCNCLMKRHYLNCNFRIVVDLVMVMDRNDIVFAIAEIVEMLLLNNPLDQIDLVIVVV